MKQKLKQKLLATTEITASAILITVISYLIEGLWKFTQALLAMPAVDFNNKILLFSLLIYSGITFVTWQLMHGAIGLFTTAFNRIKSKKESPDLTIIIVNATKKKATKKRARK